MKHLIEQIDQTIALLDRLLRQNPKHIDYFAAKATLQMIRPVVIAEQERMIEVLETRANEIDNENRWWGNYQDGLFEAYKDAVGVVKGEKI